jgi:hypothetical protein
MGDAMSELTERERRLKRALELSVGALQAVLLATETDHASKVTFTGPWVHYGSPSFDEVLDETDKVLGEGADAV